jgi:hypothetical protein
MAPGPVAVPGISEMLEKLLQFVATPVNVADDVKWSALGPSVIP